VLKAALWKDTIVATVNESAPSCLVLMPFNADRELKREIEAAIRDADFVALRIEDLSVGGLLLSPVSQALNNARCVVADLTGRNPNVFYELGLAHAMGKPTVLITESMDDVPFDLRHMRIINYDRKDKSARLRRRIADALREMGKRDSVQWQPSLLDTPGLSVSREESARTAEVLIQQAEAAYKSGSIEMAVRLLKEGADAYQAAGNDNALAVTLNNLGSMYQRMGDYSAALAVLERAVDAVKRTRNPAGEAAVYGSLANVFEARGENRRAEEFYRRALSISEELHDEPSIALHLSNLGTSKAQLGHYQEAELYYRKALEVFQRREDRASTARMLVNLGTLRLNQNQLQEAEYLFKQALGLFAELNLEPEFARALHNLASIMQERGDLTSAEEYLRKSLEIKQTLGDQAGSAATLANLGSIAASRGELDYALRLYQRALTIYQETGNYYALGQTILVTARLLATLGRKEEAIDFLTHAEDLSRDGAPAQHHEIVQRLKELRAATASE
jgi:tetratricopeptide (TPR) repeat protein